MRNTHGNGIIAPNSRMVSGSHILANAATLKPEAKLQWGQFPKHVKHNVIAARAREERAGIVAESRARLAARKW